MKLVFTNEAWTKMNHYVQACEFEISGLGNIEYQNGVPVVTDVFILKQKVTPTTTDIDPDAIYEITMAQARTKEPVNWSLWWHSHVNMATFFSGQDRATIENFATVSGKPMFSIVLNKKGDYKCRMDMKEPFSLTIDCEVETESSKTVPQYIYRDIERLVERPGYLRRPQIEEKPSFEFTGVVPRKLRKIRRLIRKGYSPEQAVSKVYHGQIPQEVSWTEEKGSEVYEAEVFETRTTTQSEVSNLPSFLRCTNESSTLRFGICNKCHSSGLVNSQGVCSDCRSDYPPTDEGLD